MTSQLRMKLQFKLKHQAFISEKMIKFEAETDSGRQASLVCFPKYEDAFSRLLQLNEEDSIFVQGAWQRNKKTNANEFIVHEFLNTEAEAIADEQEGSSEPTTLIADTPCVVEWTPELLMELYDWLIACDEFIKPGQLKWRNLLGNPRQMV